MSTHRQCCGGNLRLASRCVCIYLPNLPLLRILNNIRQVTTAHLYYAAGGYATIALNGKPVSDHVLSPGFTKYDTRMQYVVLDVKSLVAQGMSLAPPLLPLFFLSPVIRLCSPFPHFLYLIRSPTLLSLFISIKNADVKIPAGTNAFSATLGRSHYGVTQGSVWNWAGAPWHGEPVLRLVLSLTFSDGSKQRVVSDGTWKVRWICFPLISLFLVVFPFSIVFSGAKRR